MVVELMPNGDDSDLSSASLPRSSARMFIGEVTTPGAVLYDDHKRRVDARPSVHFSFSDDVYYVLSAAASGVIGNFAYAALKKLVTRRSEERGRAEVVETFEHVVRETTYERLRVERHADGATTVDAARVRRKETGVRRKRVVNRRKPRP